MAPDSAEGGGEEEGEGEEGVKVAVEGGSDEGVESMFRGVSVRAVVDSVNRGPSAEGEGSGKEVDDWYVGAVEASVEAIVEELMGTGEGVKGVARGRVMRG